MNIRIVASLVFVLALIAVVVGLGTSTTYKEPQSGCVQVWSYYPYPHLVWDCGPAGGGGGFSW